MRALGLACTLVAAAAAVFGSSTACACTGITLRAKDGSVVYARTMEFGHDFNSQAIVVPRGYAFTGSAPAGEGMSWSTKYALVGANGLQMPIVLDGMNEQGLTCGLFYFPGFAGYQEVTPADAPRTIAPWELPGWILSKFSNVEEVRAGLPEIRVAAVKLPAWDMVPPAHFIVHDAAGNCLVIEYVNGQLNLFDNPIGVITNSPTFDWHLTNLRNYVNLSSANASPHELDGVKLEQFGQGSGMLGLPGDFTPPSRFVRAVAFSHAAIPGDTGPAAIEQAFHILDNFDIPYGTVRSPGAQQVEDEITEWTTASDTQARRFYFHTHGNRRVRMIDLTRMNLDAKEIVTLPMDQQPDVQDLTPTGN